VLSTSIQVLQDATGPCQPLRVLPLPFWCQSSLAWNLYGYSCSDTTRERFGDLFLVWLSVEQLALMNYVRHSASITRGLGWLPSLDFFLNEGNAIHCLCCDHLGGHKIIHHISSGFACFSVCLITHAKQQSFLRNIITGYPIPLLLIC
jgi:hypothetical protein